jgi:hypothetical protein
VSFKVQNNAGNYTLSDYNGPAGVKVAVDWQVGGGSANAIILVSCGDADKLACTPFVWPYEIGDVATQVRHREVEGNGTVALATGHLTDLADGALTTPVTTDFGLGQKVHRVYFKATNLNISANPGTVGDATSSTSYVVLHLKRVVA